MANRLAHEDKIPDVPVFHQVLYVRMHMHVDTCYVHRAWMYQGVSIQEKSILVLIEVPSARTNQFWVR